MAIAFFEDKREKKLQKKQKTMFFILGFLIVILLILLTKQGFFKKLTLPAVKVDKARTFEKIEMDFNVLDNETLDELAPFEKMEKIETKKPKTNPFFPSSK